VSEEIESHPITLQNITDKDPIESSNIGFPLKDIFQLIYHSSLLGGVILSILFFTFYIEAFPSIDNLSQLSSYIITVFGVAFFFITYFSITIIAPALILFEHNLSNSEYKNLIWHIFIISTVIIVIINSVIYYNELECLFWLFSLFLIIPLCQYLLIKCYKYEWKTLKSFSVWGSFFSYIILSIFFIALIISSNSYQHSKSDTILISILLQAIFAIPNAIVLYNITSLTTNTISQISKIRQIVKLVSLIVIIFIGIVSLIFSVLKKPNPIIIAPFSLLKLGHYKAELHFKEDFIKKHPSFVADTNSTYNTFSVLSSIGDEYVIKKTSPFTIIHFANNETNVSQIQFNKKMYWYKENNNSVVVVWNTPNLKSIEKNTSILTKIKQEIDTTNPNKNYRVYRIKKENVDFSVVGNEIDLQLTRLRDNADF